MSLESVLWGEERKCSASVVGLDLVLGFISVPEFIKAVL